jgi:CspA family cold shock protein
VKGVVKNLQADKGWGFVSDANGFDYFFHYSALPDGVELSHLYEGQEVSWRPSDSDRGPRAEQLMIGG